MDDSTKTMERSTCFFMSSFSLPGITPRSSARRSRVVPSIASLSESAEASWFE
ncbi:hypothetical protein D3C81_1109430 [compost metagenome]